MVDFAEDYRDAYNLASLVGEYYGLAGDTLDLFDLHISHLQKVGLLAEFGTAAYDMAVAAAAMRAIELELAERNLWMLEAAILDQVPDRAVWEQAFDDAKADLDKMTSENEMDKWGKGV